MNTPFRQALTAMPAPVLAALLAIAPVAGATEQAQQQAAFADERAGCLEWRGWPVK